MRSLIMATALVLAVAAPSRAQIMGSLEGPGAVGTQIANLQGWAFTTAPGAELIQPFQVRIDGADALLVPCCGDRGDVQDAFPNAPLQTGFSAVYNWALLRGGGRTVLVEVIVRDTAGNERILSKSVDVYALSRKTALYHNLWAAEESAPSAPNREGYCRLSNEETPTSGPAQLRCHNLVATRFNADTSFVITPCNAVTLSWDRTTQGFVQTSDCDVVDRWTDNLDGTATDNWTGLTWELKTTDGTIHDVDDTYSFSDGESSEIRDGTAFTEFLGALNAATSDGTNPSSGCFAGHCDWRLPTLEELRFAGDSEECILLICPQFPGETAPATYWTSTASTDAGLAWAIDFDDQAEFAIGKFGGNRVRAVRGR